MKYEIYELYPSARHAYQPMKPAVKTSRPLVEILKTILQWVFNGAKIREKAIFVAAISTLTNSCH